MIVDDRYAAGLFDGEGYVTIGHSYGVRRSGQPWDHWYVRIGVKMCTLPILEAMLKTYGGRINKGSPGTKKRRPTWTWSLVAREAACDFSRRVAPHCLLKHEQLALVLEWHDGFIKVQGGSPMKEDEYGRRRDIHHRLRLLNGGRSYAQRHQGGKVLHEAQG